MKKLLIVLFALLFGTISFSRIAQSTEFIVDGDQIEISTGDIIIIDGDSGDIVIVDGDQIDVTIEDDVIIDGDAEDIVIIDADQDDVVSVDGDQINVDIGDVVIIDGDQTEVTTGDVVIVHKDDPITVYVDIKPGSCQNPFNIKSRGLLPVAILGDEDFDVTDIDPVSIRLEGVVPLRSSIKDVSHIEYCEDYDLDGYADLTLKFDSQAIATALGDIEDGEEPGLNLTGTLMDDTEIGGKDTLLIIKKGKKNGKKKGKKKGEKY